MDHHNHRKRGAAQDLEPFRHDLLARCPQRLLDPEGVGVSGLLAGGEASVERLHRSPLARAHRRLG
jgi:hypothetical protein